MNSDHTSSPSVTIVVVNYNGREPLERCLRSIALLNYPRKSFRAVVVDNGSTDGSTTLVTSDFPWVELIQLPENLGFAAANNRAMTGADSEYVALLNNDARVDPSWLAELVAASLEPAVGACTSKILLDQAQWPLVQNAGTRLLRNGSCADRGSLGGDRGYERDRGQYDGLEEVFSFCGAAALLKREMLRDVGLFDDTFFMYYEDVDLSWRARTKGWQVIYVPTAVAYHLHCGSSGEWSPRFVANVEGNRVATLVKNASWPLAIRGLASSALKLLQTWLLALTAIVKLDWKDAHRHTATAVAHALAIIRVAGSLPRLLALRRRNGRVRSVTAAELERVWIGGR